MISKGAVAAFLALTAVGQAPAQPTQTQPITARVFHFAHTASEPQAQEIATVVRTITGMKDVSADFAAATLTVHGTADQLDLAEWLFLGLDRAVPAPADSAVHEYRLPAGLDNVVRLFYLDRGQTLKDFQEFAAMLRTIAEIRPALTYNEGRILAMRGTTDQMSMADWFISALAKSAPAPHPHSVTPEYLLPATPSPQPNENVTRIYFVANAPTPQEFQEVANVLRDVVDIRRVFTYNAPRAIALRGTADQLALGEWLFNEIDQPRNGPSSNASSAYHFQDPTRENASAVRVFYFPHAATVQDFQKIAATLREGARVRRVITYNSTRAISVRGTPDQLERVQRLLPVLAPADFPQAP